MLQAHEYMTSAELGRTFQVDHPDDGESGFIYYCGCVNMPGRPAQI